jgi:4-amino-4-deoxy-L-arabinose transferase-like glycosyltransferase
VPQLVHPLWAELAILNLRLMSGGDQFASLIQWLSMVGAIIGATAIASLLGAGKAWQWVTLAFAISLPTGILEATSTQNDAVVALWLVCLLYFIFRNSRIVAKKTDLALIGLALGLGMLTKGTFFPYAAGAMLYLVYSLVSKSKILKTITSLLIIGFFAVLLNLGVWSRNVMTFGTPLGPKAFVSNFAAQSFGPIQILSGVSRNLAQNFSTPDEELNHQIVTKLKNALGRFDPAMESFDIEWGWNHEDLAGNPLHLMLMVASLFILILMKKKILDPAIWIYMVIVLSMYLFFAAIVKYDLYGNRYQLPFFIAWSPLFGIAVGIIGKIKLSTLTTLLLLLSAFPWVLFNRTRPLIAMRDSTDPYTLPCLAGCTAGSILNEPPEKTMFAVWGNLGTAYVAAMDQVRQTGCKEIGLKLDSNDLEYAYWWLLGAPQNGMRLESIVTYPELERYLDPTFKPCVIICTTCGEQDSLFGLNRIGSFGNGRIKIYTGKNYIHP